MQPLYQRVADVVSAGLGMPVELVQRSSYVELERGEDDFAFLCGLPYVEVVDGMVAALTPVVAPVPAGARYGDRPIYFSDVVVPVDSTPSSFADLRGARWAFNEPASHSGYLITLQRLATMGEDTGFFREWIAAGFHQHALQMVAAGEADGAAIDSHLLEVLVDREPGLGRRLRVVESLGPSTIQPLVAGAGVAENLLEGDRAALLHVPRGDARLHQSRVARFAAVDDADYDGIRRMLDTAKMAGLWVGPRPPGLGALLA